MAEDKVKEAQRIAEANVNAEAKVKRPMTAVRRIATQGAVRRPMTPKVGRGF